MSLLRLLGLAPEKETAAPSETGSETLERIAAALERHGPDRARFIASFAYTLSRVAHADLDISDDETRVMRQIVLEHAGLDEAEASLVVEIAKEHTVLFGATQGFLVTREYNKRATREDKIALLDCLFAVCAADHTITSEEEKEIRKISDELLLTHKDYIATRLNYRDRLSVFQNPSGGSS
ncbi:MAG: tellurite resistance TerB family protein [Planctomycetota bacterium]|jgi:uncharacterized tellurite resistance protein B-like protein